jgi:hypothetical protein
MTKAKESNTTTRRTLLVAVPAVAVMALTTPSADADPIFAAIDAHREADGKVDTEHAKLVAVGLDGDNWMPTQAALMAECAAAKALIGTTPTTRAGLLALEAHLRDDRHRSARWAIRIPVILDGFRATSNCEQEAVDWLIAQRASEMSGGAPPRPWDVEDVLSAIRSGQARRAAEDCLT